MFTRLICGIMLLSLLTFNCTQVIIDGAGADKVASISPVAGNNEYNIVNHFRTQAKVWYLLWGLVPVSSPNVGEIVAKYSAGGDGVINLKIIDEFSLVDCLLENVLLSVISANTRTVIIEGDVIKYKK